MANRNYGGNGGRVLIVAAQAAAQIDWPQSSPVRTVAFFGDC
jgi:hypothetical protein